MQDVKYEEIFSICLKGAVGFGLIFLINPGTILLMILHSKNESKWPKKMNGVTCKGLLHHEEALEKRVPDLKAFQAASKSIRAVLVRVVDRSVGFDFR